MQVIWQPKAVKQLKKIGNRITQERILVATRGLVDFPACSGVKQLVQHQYTHRLKVGDWRVLFSVFQEVSVISVEEVKKRDDHTY
ncbi:MAG: type II toxin-antitoxin system RelE/ParE family toxin [Desulfobacterales bacterium]|nr:type II toxin-antitoxin system RelE/ParE family toxin [Desulfobacterales bacterium]